MTKYNEAWSLLKRVLPIVAWSGNHRLAREITNLLAQPILAARDHDSCDAEKAALVRVLRSVDDYLFHVTNLSRPPKGTYDVSRIVTAALADTSPAAATLLAQGDRESKLADSFVAIIEAEGYLPKAFKAKALQVAKAALSIREKARAALSPGEKE